MGNKLTLALVIALGGLGGCGGPQQQFDVNGLVLDVQDQLYVSRPTGYFCNTVPMDQIKIQLVDYGPACYLDRQQGAPDPRNLTQEHVELDIILGLSGHKSSDPYTMAKIDCETMGANGTAYLLHYPPQAKTPDNTIQVDSGTVVIKQYDPNNVKPVLGTFDLSFAGKEIKGNLNALDCDPTS